MAAQQTRQNQQLNVIDRKKKNLYNFSFHRTICVYQLFTGWFTLEIRNEIIFTLASTVVDGGFNCPFFLILRLALKKICLVMRLLTWVSALVRKAKLQNLPYPNVRWKTLLQLKRLKGKQKQDASCLVCPRQGCAPKFVTWSLHETLFLETEREGGSLLLTCSSRRLLLAPVWRAESLELEWQLMFHRKKQNTAVAI